MAKTKQEISVLWAVICSSSTIDQTSNNISLYKVLEAVQFEYRGQPIPEGPMAVPFGHEFIALFHRNGSTDSVYTTDATVTIHGPEGTVLHEVSASLKFEKGMRRVRLIVANQALSLTVEGEYWYSVREGNGPELFKVPLEVTIT